MAAYYLQERVTGHRVEVHLGHPGHVHRYGVWLPDGDYITTSTLAGLRGRAAEHGYQVKREVA